jgi:RluA family pseudouridine synthase
MPGFFRKREWTESHYLITYIVDDSNKGLRLDLYLKKHYTNRSRNWIHHLIHSSLVLVNDKPSKPSYKLKPGEIIKIFIEKNTKEPEINREYKIVFEDKDIMVINKPGNLPVHPAGSYLFNTLISLLKLENQAPNQDYYLIHRLDRETSGLIVLGKNSKSANLLIQQFLKRTPIKRYYAIVQGRVQEDEFSIDADIGPALNSKIRLKMQAYPKGTYLTNTIEGVMPALTHFKVLKRMHSTTLLDCKLETGRQHQIRVHLAYKGYPVLGDKLYNGDDSIFLSFLEKKLTEEEVTQILGFHRHALHAYYLSFEHPRTREKLKFEIDLSDDLKQLISS